MKNIAAGIDVGGTNTVIGMVDSDGKCWYKTSISTPGYDDAAVFVHEIARIIKEYFLSNTTSNLVGIGIGAPNGNYYNGSIEFAPNLKWKGVVPLVGLFRQHFDVPVVLTNDANAAAIGEMVYGNAKGMKNFIEITLGTGVGSGIVVDANMVYGHDGFAGEIGHAIVFPGGRVCGCGRSGCLEAYCSASGIVKTYNDLLARDGKKTEGEITPYKISKLAEKGDKTAISTYEYTGEILGLGLSNSVAHTSPEAIFIFGGIANAGELLFKPLKESFEKYLLQVYRNKISILPSGIMENDAAILGAASLVWKQ
ncbi:MAG TPA: ROK family protein [Bacteroidales bacterium]|nr:ROK family protein [Bacteroidales bacterium]